MKLTKNIHLKRINLRKIGLAGGGKESCEHPDINGKKTYMVKYEGEVMIGKFEKEWYGWNFCWFGMSYVGLQLDVLDEVWEVVT